MGLLSLSLSSLSRPMLKYKLAEFGAQVPESERHAWQYNLSRSLHVNRIGSSSESTGKCAGNQSCSATASAKHGSPSKHLISLGKGHTSRTASSCVNKMSSHAWCPWSPKSSTHVWLAVRCLLRLGEDTRSPSDLHYHLHHLRSLRSSAADEMVRGDLSDEDCLTIQQDLQIPCMTDTFTTCLADAIER